MQRSDLLHLETPFSQFLRSPPFSNAVASDGQEPVTSVLPGQHWSLGLCPRLSISGSCTQWPGALTVNTNTTDSSLSAQAFCGRIFKDYLCNSPRINVKWVVI